MPRRTPGEALLAGSIRTPTPVPAFLGNRFSVQLPRIFCTQGPSPRCRAQPRGPKRDDTVLFGHFQKDNGWTRLSRMTWTGGPSLPLDPLRRPSHVLYVDTVHCSLLVTCGFWVASYVLSLDPLRRGCVSSCLVGRRKVSVSRVTETSASSVVKEPSLDVHPTRPLPPSEVRSTQFLSVFCLSATSWAVVRFLYTSGLYASRALSLDR